MFRKTLYCAAIGLVSLIVSLGAWSQSYPTKPVRFLVGYAPGGSSDVVARIYGQKVSSALGQQVVVENRPGAVGSIAGDQVAKSEPDGYRLMVTGSGTFIYAVLSKTVPYNMLRDFTPIVHIGATPLALVAHPSVPARSVRELIQLARSKPGALTFGSEGTGGISHLAGELFSQMANVKLVHVPYKSAADSTVATAGGQVSLNFPALTSALPLLRAEKYRVVAVTSLKRSMLLPSVPTLDESGLRGFDQVVWFGFFGPAGMPKHIVDRLHAVLVDATNSPDVREALQKQGVEIELKSPEQLAALMRESAVLISRLAKDVKLTME